MRHRKEIDTCWAHVRTLRVLAAGLALACAGLWWGWHTAPEDIRVHQTPELRTGGVMEAGEIPEPVVYTFTFYIWQQLWRWEDDGADEYPENIWRLQSYMTPRFLQVQEADLERRAQSGELDNRSRYIREIPGARFEPARVERLGDDTWQVFLDVEIQEYIDGELVKDIEVRYPLRVVRFEVDPEGNPWGLALDGYTGEPERLETHVEEES
ncbi:PFL_4703 family integrating conjugative element protein [Halorhodospira halophila]|uniref:PFL_4703 family integrating conjugative element protein n=1 Tax=Halorhodospira halophila TaxID=1053 RepID=UPI001913FE76|nr:TIGR03746 family integrating conjugative element protein [Halorhodospira halophila]MBK5944841.1 integrating conjugative element protein [Halorhodospira halophila]